uniref:Ground-like domain-containing protein n=1 Tax=Plectus sambesii TaxID=2011161 RepID=A0A914X3Z8_9BILA
QPVQQPQPPPIQNSCSGGCVSTGVQYQPQSSCNSVGCIGGGGVSSNPVGGCTTCQTQRRRLRFYTHRHTRNANNETITIKEATFSLHNSQVDNPVCNSNSLRAIITENLSTDAVKSKKEIYNAAVKAFGGHYAVICSTAHFEFIADSHHYCLHGNNNMTCYAFQTQKKPAPSA